MFVFLLKPSSDLRKAGWLSASSFEPWPRGWGGWFGEEQIVTSLCPDTAVPFYMERRDSGSQTGIKIGSAKSLKMSFFLPQWL